MFPRKLISFNVGFYLFKLVAMIQYIGWLYCYHTGMLVLNVYWMLYLPLVL